MSDHNKKIRNSDELSIAHIQILDKIRNAKIFPRAAMTVINDIETKSDRNTIQKFNDLRVNEYIESKSKGYTEIKGTKGEKGKGKYDCFIITSKGKKFLDDYGYEILNNYFGKKEYSFKKNSTYTKRLASFVSKERQKRIVFLNEVFKNFTKDEMKYISADELKKLNQYPMFNYKSGKWYGILITPYMIYPIYNSGAFPLEINSVSEDNFQTIAISAFKDQINIDLTKKGRIIFGKNAELAYKLIFNDANLKFKIKQNENCNEGKLIFSDNYIFDVNSENDFFFHTMDRAGKEQLKFYAYKNLEEIMKIKLFNSSDWLGTDNYFSAGTDKYNFYIGTRQELHGIKFLFDYLGTQISFQKKPCIVCFDFQEKFYKELFKEYKAQIIRMSEFENINKAIKENEIDSDILIITIPNKKVLFEI